MAAEELWTIGFLYTITMLFCLPERIISQKLDFQDEEIHVCEGFDHPLANNSHVILPVQLSDMDKPCGINFPRLEFDELLDCICNNNNNNEPSKQCVVSWNENDVGNVSFQKYPFLLQRCENNVFVPFGGLVVACSNYSVISSSTIDRCENVPILKFDWTCSSLPRTLHLGGDWILQVQQSGNEAEVTVCSYSKSTCITPTTPTTALTTTTETAAALTTTTTAAALTIAPTIRTSLTTTTTISPTPYSSTSVKSGNSRTNGLTSTSNTPGSTDSSESDESDDKLKIIIINIVTSITALTAIILTVIIIIRKRNKQQNMSSEDVEPNKDTPAQPESVGLNGTTNMAYEDSCDSEEPFVPVHLSSPNLDNNPNFDSTPSPDYNEPVDIPNPNLDDSPNFDGTTRSTSYYNEPVHLSNPNLDDSPNFDSTSISYYNGPAHLPTLDHNPDFDGTSTSYYNTLT